MLGGKIDCGVSWRRFGSLWKLLRQPRAHGSAPLPWLRSGATPRLQCSCCERLRTPRQCAQQRVVGRAAVGRPSGAARVMRAAASGGGGEVWPAQGHEGGDKEGARRARGEEAAGRAEHRVAGRVKRESGGSGVFVCGGRVVAEKKFDGARAPHNSQGGGSGGVLCVCGVVALVLGAARA